MVNKFSMFCFCFILMNKRFLSSRSLKKYLDGKELYAIKIDKYCKETSLLREVNTTGVLCVAFSYKYAHTSVAVINLPIASPCPFPRLVLRLGLS